MRIISLRPGSEDFDGNIIATLDAEVAPGIVIHRITLKRNQAGEIRIYGPRVGAKNVAFLAPPQSEELKTLALSEMKGRTLHGYR